MQCLLDTVYGILIVSSILYVDVVLSTTIRSRSVSFATNTVGTILVSTFSNTVKLIKKSGLA